MMRRLAAVLPFLVMMAALSSCGEGCGEDSSKKGGSGSSSSGGNVSGGKQSGSGEVNLADWDGQKSGPAAPQQPSQPAQQAQQPQKPAAPPPAPPRPGLDAVAPSDWTPKVKKAGLVFVLVTGKNCADCDLVSPVLRGLSGDFPDWKFYSLDASTKEGAALLPRSMSPLPLPGFLIYEGGTTKSRRQGMPFPKSGSELELDYQGRLGRWFRDAFTQKSFTFSGKKLEKFDRKPL